MLKKTGFTLTEIIVALIITGILAAIAIPNYVNYIYQGAAKAAQNNLVTIYNAQKNYYFSNAKYYNSAATPDTNLNTNLSVNITDSYFTYTCSGTSSTFSCTATNTSNDHFVLTVTNGSIVLPGSSGTLNPSCVDTANPDYCPN